ncbi:PP2C family protein-serine/threonine phosphatase, partial [Streptomyces sp. NPDC047022]|uniref:PP2C family protein-serine/threonine phosphatase n=1 Tax=Streptomyces sp. NPDC047022 TaxID=3155737 RepID=UPI0033F34587
IVNCGHPPPLLIRDGSVQALANRDPAPPLGMRALAPAGGTTDTFAFIPGDTLMLYTDGVIEARNREGTFYPLARKVGPWARSTPQSLVQRLRLDLLTHCGGRLGDDAALVAIERLPTTPPALHSSA